MTFRIAGASGFWGDSPLAVGQLLPARPDVIVFDYLAEVTLSLLARQKAKDPGAGYARDFVSTLAPHLDIIAERGTKIVSNAGGLNPLACADALRSTLAGRELSVATVTGDDMMERLDSIAAPDMFSGAAFPDPDLVASANVYLGAFPVAEALARGADIVITGRTVDSAGTLGALIHHYGWQPSQLDRLAQGALAGHLLECGTQVSGGNATDWQGLDFARIGYPFADIDADGSFILSKAPGTDGRVAHDTVVEQLLYEIGDPSAYILPDVICDFTEVRLEDLDEDRVRVSGARGRGSPTHLKASITFHDGHRISAAFQMVGAHAADKAKAFADAALSRTRDHLSATNLGPFTDIRTDILGDPDREVIVILSAHHPEARACAQLLREATGLALSAPPGLALLPGGRPRPSPVIRLHSSLVPKADVIPIVEVNGQSKTLSPSPASPLIPAPEPIAPAAPTNLTHTLPLANLAWLRSGDKGDIANIGVAAREPDVLPCLWHALTPDRVAEHMAFATASRIDRYHLPGVQALNLVLHDALGGGGMASLAPDPQGKTYGQRLATLPIPVTSDIFERFA